MINFLRDFRFYHYLTIASFSWIIMLGMVEPALSDCGCKLKKSGTVKNLPDIVPTNPNDTLPASTSKDEGSIFVPNGAVMAITKGEGYLPKNFRTLYKNPVFKAHGINGDILRVSGSAQPTPSQMEHVIQEIRTLANDPTVPIYIMDLRLEPHGFYKDELVQIHDGFLWRDFDPSFTETYEQAIFENLKSLDELTLYRGVQKEELVRRANRTDTVSDHKDVLQTEKQLCQKLGVHYVRLPVLDHSAATAKIVEAFFNFLSTLPKNAWVHMHCSAGCGRTSTFFVLYDLYMRKPKGSLTQLLKLHRELGSIDFYKKGEEYKQENAQKRLGLITVAFKNRQKYR